MSLPKSPWLVAAVALLWAVGNIVTVRWNLQPRPWFLYLVLAAIGLTFAILWLDSRLVKLGRTRPSRWTNFYQALGVTALFGLPFVVLHEAGFGFILVMCLCATVVSGIAAARGRHNDL